MRYYENRPMLHRYEQVQCISKEEFRRRWRETRAVMAEHQVGVLIVLEGEWEGYSQWLAGTRWAKAVIVPADGPIVAVYGDRLVRPGDTVCEDLAQHRQVMAQEVERVDPDIRWVEGFDGAMVKNMLHESGRDCLGFIHQESLTASWSEYLRTFLPDVPFEDLTLAIDPVKATKSEEEMALIENAVQLHERVMAAMPAIIRPGRTVQQINAEARWLCEQLGSGGNVCLNFALQFGNDREGPLAHHSGIIPYPERPVRYGDRIFILLESNGIGGHFTALGRNFCLGEPPEEIQAYWQLCLQMQDFAAARLKPGAVIREIYEENIAFIERLGNQTNVQNYLHSLGYVFGEKPYLFDASETIPLRENMVYLDHPHVRINRGPDTGKVPYDDLYSIDTYRITADGGVRMNRTPREIVVIP